MSYLGRSGSAAGEGQTVLGGGGGGAGGALSFPFSWRAGLLLLVGVGHQSIGEGKGPEWLTEDGRQCHGEMPGVGRGSVVVGGSPDWQSERTSRGSQSRDSREQLLCERLIEARCKVEGGVFVHR